MNLAEAGSGAAATLGRSLWADGPPMLMPPESRNFQRVGDSGHEDAPRGEPASPAGADLDWRVVESVATRVGGAAQSENSKQEAELLSDFEGATSYAELLVADYTDLYPTAGHARVKVIDRAGWVRANIAIFRHFLRPVASRLSAPGPEPTTDPSSLLPTYLSAVDDLVSSALSAMRGAARTVVSAQVGLVLGFLSRRVLGQYDLVLPEDGKDSLYYVGPNILAVERRFGFSRKDFRLWIALHEVTHRTQFTGVPWLKDYFTSLVDQVMEGTYVDPQAFLAGLRRMAEAIARGKDPLGEVGLAGAFASEEQRENMRRLQALMCLLEGHGNAVMDSIGEKIIPRAAQMSELLRARRASNGLQRVVFRLLGIDTKLRQYELGERFVRAVMEQGGKEVLDEVWKGPENLPSLEEIESPDRWLARIRR